MRFGGIPKNMSIQHHITEGQTGAAGREQIVDLSSYPVDMSSFLMLSQSTLDPAGVPYQVSPAGYDPRLIAHYALAHWNQYLATNNEEHCNVFLTQAYWLVEHAEHIDEDASGWPISFHHPDVLARGPCLSASAQGSGISVLMRAYQLTHEEAFRELISRVVRTFERDILDGGVSAPVGADGIFFEDVAVYPATHMLSGFIFALFGLYDYVALTGNVQIEKLISHRLVTMHDLLNEFDLGFWTCIDLLHRRLASPSHLALQTMLLEALARRSDCNHCSRLVSRWKGYQHRFGSRLRYLIADRWASYRHALWGRIRTALFPAPQPASSLHICIPLPAFPLIGGILTVLEGVAQVTKDIWQLEYVTQIVGPHPDGFTIYRFGTARMTPSAFPNVWLYILAGFRKLMSRIHHDAGYHVILPQDSLFTGAFAALAAKVAGVRVVCIDHGHLTWLTSRVSDVYRAERLDILVKRKWHHWALRLLARLRFELYWLSLLLIAQIPARFVDHFLVPGVAGDDVEESCKNLRISSSRITRYPSMIDIDQHIVLDAESKASIREKNGLAADAIVISIICRLAPEKGIDIALESISRAFSAISPDLSARVRIIIAGDGPFRKQIEEDICIRGLSQTCLLWGEISAAEVMSLLAISDIFLYTSTRGACFAMAVLEAMASGCAVVASTEPMSNAHLLAEGRGIAVPPGDAEQTALALRRLVNDLALCRQMGNSARDYVKTYHSPTVFRRTLMRATYWSALDEILAEEKKAEAAPLEGSES